MCFVHFRTHWHVQEECRALISACMARGNAQLALSIYGTMCRVRPGSSSASADRHREELAWPPATLETVSAVVSGHCRATVFSGTSLLALTYDGTAELETAGSSALQQYRLLHADWLILCIL